MPNYNYNNKNNKADRVILEETFDYEKLELNSSNIQAILGANSDFVNRQIFIHNNRDLEASVFFIDGMVENQLVSEYVIKPLMQSEQFKACSTEAEAIKKIEEGAVYYPYILKRTSINDVLTDILTGSTVIVFNKQKLAFAFDTKGFEMRGVQEPSVENVMKGAKDSFCETLRVNTATCRRKIKSPNLVIEETIVGRQTKTSVAIIYLKNIANPGLVEKVKKRLDEIEVDAVLSPAYVEELIIDTKYTGYPQIQYTERPDRFCNNLTEGRVGIILDGMPVAYIIPGTFLQFLQAPEDYSQNWLVSTALRYVRFTALFITLLLPAFYVSITNFHQEMIPTELIFSIIASKEGVPFPMFLEVLGMLVAFEVLIEAGLRLPKTVGQTVSIVGALVVGQSAVEAKLLSPATVVIIAITAITGFTLPNVDFNNAIRLWRFIVTIFSCIIGMYGLTMGLILLIYQWCNIETFGVPYLSPFVGGEKTQVKDTMMRLHIKDLRERPRSLKTLNKNSQSRR